MKRQWMVVALACAVLAGCSEAQIVPPPVVPQVVLSQKNYRMAKLNAIGSSTGFSLLGLLPITSPRQIKAMSDLYEGVSAKPDAAYALTNIAQEKSNTYLLLFSLSRITVRADVIEFVDERDKPPSLEKKPDKPDATPPKSEADEGYSPLQKR